MKSSVQRHISIDAVALADVHGGLGQGTKPLVTNAVATSDPLAGSNLASWAVPGGLTPGDVYNVWGGSKVGWYKYTVPQKGSLPSPGPGVGQGAGVF